MVYELINDTNKTTPEIRVAFVCYSPNASFIRNDYRILSKHFCVDKFNYRRAWDALGMMAVIWRSDVSFSWFAGGHAFLAVLFSKILRKKAIVVAGGFDVAYVPEINYGQFTLGWHKKTFTKFALKYADIILPVSDFTKREVLFHVKPRNVQTVYNGINSEKFMPGCEKCNLVITVASGWGSVITLKGLDIFTQIAALIPDTEFVVIGLSEIDMDTLKTPNLRKNIKLFGHVSQDELISWYQKAKVYCQLSYRESFGMALAEAMLCGCVPVVTERGALPEVVGDTGFYVPYGDPEATAEAIKKALKSEKGAGARERIIKIFSLERRENELKEIIQDIWYNPSEDTA
ncbi:MAG: Glycosyl transferase, group 1 family protein [Methanothrix harundinacea]|jgi:glycosyltransferase involved in cell wall biosynthesis|uniref:Glycosyl transferase, group 1 family protein n=1 Tax=Methanothrix harundinacea TaxID=301375 RepID=A0A101IKZ6_9EURY|nr:MAG: Glycosyl transferase, group 1 family protein [Methanothrix harundinacea]